MTVTDRKTDPLADEKLLQLLEKEHSYYQTIRSLSLEEKHLLNINTPLVEITPILNQKKLLVASIQTIDTALTPLKTYWEQRKNMKDTYSEKIKTQLHEIQRLLAEILEINQSSQQKVELHLKELQLKQQLDEPNPMEGI